tara:strand:- start:330 stop:644 length:315 start_codon:yes stop_codon:yes gene_type:complete
VKLSDASFSKSPAQLAGVNPVNASATCAASNAFAVSAAPDVNVKKLGLNIADETKKPRGKPRGFFVSSGNLLPLNSFGFVSIQRRPTSQVSLVKRDEYPGVRKE